MTAYAVCPFASFSSSTAAFVIDDVMMVPPISSFTCAVVAPLVTSTTVPLIMLRALSFMDDSFGLRLPSARRARVLADQLVDRAELFGGAVVRDALDRAVV